MDISGYVVLGIVTLFLVYLMPQLIRGRQDVVDSRLADRFSADLRILATAGTPGGGSRASVDDGAPRAYLHDPRLRTEVSAMNRPTTRVALPATAQPVNPDEKRESNSRPAPALAQRPQVSAAVAPSVPSRGLAGQRPSGAGASRRGPVRPEVARRRRAAARRRLVLTLALLALSAWAWVSVAAGAAHVALAFTPTVLLATVLVLGRRAAIAAARGHAAARRASARAARPAAVAPRGSRPEVAPPHVSARPASRPAGRDARAEHAGTTQILAAQRRNVNARRGAAQNGGAQAPHAPAAAATPAAKAEGATASKRASRDAGTEIIPRVSAVEAAGHGVGTLRSSDEPSAPQAREIEPARVEDGSVDRRAQDGAAVVAREAVAREVVARDAVAARTPSTRSWTPVPVPVPTYTLKPAAPRGNPPALSAAEGGPTPAEPAATTEAPGATADSGAQSPDPQSTVSTPVVRTSHAPVAEAPQAPAEEPAEAATASRLDLDAVLSRRRASGE